MSGASRSAATASFFSFWPCRSIPASLSTGTPRLPAAASSGVPAAASSSSLVAKAGSCSPARCRRSSRSRSPLTSSNGRTVSGPDLGDPDEVPAERALDRLAHHALGQRERDLVELLGQVALAQRPELGALDALGLERRGRRGERLAAGDPGRRLPGDRLVRRQQLLDRAPGGGAVLLDPLVVLGPQVRVGERDVAGQVVRPDHDEGHVAQFGSLVAPRVRLEVGLERRLVRLGHLDSSASTTSARPRRRSPW
jgi:hypothetical protein